MKNSKLSIFFSLLVVVGFSISLVCFRESHDEEEFMFGLGFAVVIISFLIQAWQSDVKKEIFFYKRYLFRILEFLFIGLGVFMVFYGVKTDDHDGNSISAVGSVISGIGFILREFSIDNDEKLISNSIKLYFVFAILLLISFQSANYIQSSKDQTNYDYQLRDIENGIQNIQSDIEDLRRY